MSAATASRFPTPGRCVRHALAFLHEIQAGKATDPGKESQEEAGGKKPPANTTKAAPEMTAKDKTNVLRRMNPDLLPRPWDPPTCPPTLLGELWVWLDEVVAWLNREYSWQPETMIPACWPAHPHIAHELAVLACLRYDAGRTYSPDTLEQWHRQVLPGFLTRMQTRLGANMCPPGKHADWPGGARHAGFSTTPAQTRRTATLIDHATANGSTDPRTSGRVENAAQLVAAHAHTIHRKVGDR